VPRDDVPLRAPDGYFPAQVWRISTPEAQGLDSRVLSDLFDAVESRQLPIHSLQIVRYGYLVVDAYFHPFAADGRHDVASVTKSITTTLIGQALEQGAVPGLDVPVVPQLTSAAPDDPRKQRITVRHLLTTSSGLECGHAPYEREMLEMTGTPHWIDYALALPMREEPGQRFVYCSPGFHLLSALLTRRTSRSAEDFARTHLFGPLGITDVVWPCDPDGFSQGAGDLQMHPTDMARFGYLFLRQGEWAGQQVVPRWWVERATQRQVSTPSSESYGFGWWISNDIPGLYQAAGRGGQRIIVWPDKDVVVVTTGGGFEPGALAPYLLRALRSNAALPPNPGGVARLQERIAAAARPRTAPLAKTWLPALSAAVSGVEYQLDANPLGVRSMQLSFLDAAQASAEIALRVGQVTVPIGLDGAFRFGTDPRTGEPIAGRGRWLGADELLLEIDTIGRINFFSLRLGFQGDKVSLQVTERAGLIAAELTGRAAR
jgi:CubicO group peptidase (beta-lactamase class C family)